MAPEGAEKPAESTEKPMSVEELKQKAMLQLLFVNRDAEAESTEDPSKVNVDASLWLARKYIRELQKKCPTDPDVKILHEMCEDLLTDYEQGKLPVLDKANEFIIDFLNTESVKQGVRTEVPEYSVVAPLIDQLKLIGVTPSYVVTKGNPDAKTVVVFLQVHTRPEYPGLDVQDAMGVSHSQDQICDAVVKGCESGLFNIIYDEGVYSSSPEAIPRDHDYSENPSLDKSVMAGPRAKNILGKRLDVKGYEEALLNPEVYIQKRSQKMMDAFVDNIDFVEDEHPELDTNFIKDKALKFYRASAINYFIARNVALDFQKRTGNVAFMTMGAGHESPEEIFDRKFSHPLPVSTTLALQNLNVVVVDTSQAFTEENYQKAMDILRKRRIGTPKYKWLIRM